ncbi:MAG: ribosome-associated translation inhibitor RaiA [Candidatus Pacebacteria bacterium]|nr:ribosome-associated translation inhibitor RaiA [Candidatus Paceibacterota bacterium]
MSRITIKATNVELTQNIKEYVEKRTNSLEKYLSGDDIVYVEVEQKTKHKQGDIFRAEIRFVYQGKSLYAESTKSDIMSAIDEATNDIERRTNSLRTRLLHSVRKGAQRIKDMTKSWYTPHDNQ